MPEGSGVGLGTATGKVRIDAELDAAAAQINQFSSQSEKQFAKIDAATRRTEQALGALAGAFGISLGVQGVAQLGKAVVASAELATSYERQLIAAENLAGSQEKLNELLAVYEQSTGGAVDQATALQNVTKLMAVGFGDNAAELEQFATAIRGISLAMGQNQEAVTQQLVLELFTQRGARLDQLGLQYDLIKARADELAKADGSLTAQMAYQQAVLEQANERFGALATSSAGAATGIEKLAKAWKDFQLALGQGEGGGAVNSWAEGATGELEGLRHMLFLVQEDIRRTRQEWDTEIGSTSFGKGVQDFMTADPLGDWLRQSEKRFGPTFENYKTPSWMTSSNTPLAPAAAPGFSAEANEAMLEWAAERTEIESQANADILDENNSYQRQRADMIADYEKNLTRSAANYAKQRARSIEDYEKGVARFERDAQAQRLRMAEDHERNMARMREDHDRRLADLQEDLDTRNSERRAESAERLADFAEDRDEGIAEAREKSAGRLLEIEEDYTRDRARAARQHGDTLDEAAANLDAKAVYNEQRRFARENADAEEAHTEKVSDEQKKLDESIKNLNEAYDKKVADENEALQKSIDQAQTAYDKQVADANAAFGQRELDAIASYKQQAIDFETQHQQRLTDMAGDFTEEMTQRDNDQIARIGEMKIDHQEDLTELDTEHGERLTQIGTHAAEERGKLDTEFEKRMTQLTGHEFDLELEAFKHQDRMLGGYQDYLDDMEKEQIKHQIRMLRLLAETPGLTPAEIAEIDAAITDLGIALGKVGDAATHVDPRIAPVPTYPGEVITSSVIGGSSIVPAAGTTGRISGAGGTAVTIAPGAIVINAAAGASVAGMGDEFERRLLDVLKRVGKVGVR